MRMEARDPEVEPDFGASLKSTHHHIQISIPVQISETSLEGLGGGKSLGALFKQEGSNGRCARIGENAFRRNMSSHNPPGC